MLPALQEPGRLLLAGLGVPTGPAGGLSHRVLTLRVGERGPAGPVPYVLAASHEATGINKCSIVLSRQSVVRSNISECAWAGLFVTESMNRGQARLILNRPGALTGTMAPGANCGVVGAPVVVTGAPVVVVLVPVAEFGKSATGGVPAAAQPQTVHPLQSATRDSHARDAALQM